MKVYIELMKVTEYSLDPHVTTQCVILMYQSHLIDQTSVFVVLFVEKHKQ